MGPVSLADMKEKYYEMHNYLEAQGSIASSECL
jgi:hypothetical protein